LHRQRAVQRLLPQPGRAYKNETQFRESAVRRWGIITRLDQGHDSLTVVARRQGEEDKRHRRVALLEGHLVITVAS
jgi:hypothetical protein